MGLLVHKMGFVATVLAGTVCYDSQFSGESFDCLPIEIQKQMITHLKALIMPSFETLKFT